MFLFVSGILILPGKTSVAQDNWPMFSQVGQGTFSNPALQNNTGKLIAGMPVFSGTSLTVDMNFAYNYLFSNDLISYSLDKFYNKLEPYGKVQARYFQNYFFASYKKKKWNYSFSYSDKSTMKTRFDREIISYLRDGNLGYQNKTKDFGKADFKFNYYTEISFGLSKQIWDNFDVGIRSKFLLGRLFFEGQNLRLSVADNPQTEILSVQAEGQAVLSGPFKINKMSGDATNFASDLMPGDFFLRLKNLGYAMDFGVIYRPNRISEVSFSIIDLGFTTYKDHTFDIDFVHPLEYKRNTLYQSVAPGSNAYIEPREAIFVLGDSLSYVVEVEKTIFRKTEMIPLQAYATYKYKISRVRSAGATAQVKFYNPDLNFRLSGFYTQKVLKDRLELSGSLTLFDISDLTAGIGACYTSNHIQAYLYTSNIKTFVFPISAKKLNLSAGINFLFATKN